MAPGDPAQPQPASAKGAVSAQTVLGVCRARRFEPAARREERRKCHPIDADEGDQHPDHRCPNGEQRPIHRGAPPVPRRRARSSSSLVTSLKPAFAAEGRARITRSVPTGNRSGALRHPSRTILLMRFRTTALPTLRVTVIPNLAAAATATCRGLTGLSARRSTKNWKCLPLTRRPRPWTSRYSRRLRSRRSRGKRNPAGTRRPRLSRRYFFEMVTVSCLRPFRRRRRITARPAAVFMRLRNPWVRLRLLRCGWNVLFTTYLRDWRPQRRHQAPNWGPPEITPASWTVKLGPGVGVRRNSMTLERACLEGNRGPNRWRGPASRAPRSRSPVLAAVSWRAPVKTWRFSREISRLRATKPALPSMIARGRERTLDQHGKFANSSRDRRAHPSRRRPFACDRSRQPASDAGLRAVRSRRAENYTRPSIVPAVDVKKTFEIHEFSPRRRGPFSNHERAWEKAVAIFFH